MDLKTMTVEQIKSLAYDQIMLLNQTQTNINLIQQELVSRQTKEQNGTDKDKK